MVKTNQAQVEDLIKLQIDIFIEGNCVCEYYWTSICKFQHWYSFNNHLLLLRSIFSVTYSRLHHWQFVKLCLSMLSSKCKYF